jgi:hypothetical protein
MLKLNSLVGCDWTTEDLGTDFGHALFFYCFHTDRPRNSIGDW